jgi:hypothetical protein
MTRIAFVTRWLDGLRLAHSRSRTERAIRDLSLDQRKDIGWPDRYGRSTAYGPWRA